MAQKVFEFPAKKGQKKAFDSAEACFNIGVQASVNGFEPRLIYQSQSRQSLLAGHSRNNSSDIAAQMHKPSKSVSLQDKMPNDNEKHLYWPKKLYRQETQGLFGQSIAGFQGPRLRDDSRNIQKTISQHSFDSQSNSDGKNLQNRGDLSNRIKKNIIKANANQY